MHETEIVRRLLLDPLYPHRTTPTPPPRLPALSQTCPHLIFETWQMLAPLGPYMCYVASRK